MGLDILEYGIFFSELFGILQKDFKDGKLTGKELKEFLNSLIDDDIEIDLNNLVRFVHSLREKLREV